MALGLWGDGGGAPTRFRVAVDEIATLGASHVALVVTWSQPDVRANALRAGSRTMDDATVRATIAHARARGLEVLLFPIITLDQTGPGEWRGTLAPADPAAWWASYERFILHYAAMAADTGAEALLIGSELGTTEAWRGRWYHLISRVERRYAGALLYSANWDHYTQVSFWPRVAAVGINGYFGLASAAGASEAEMRRAWQRARAELEGFARARGKPLWITEVGYVSVRGAAAQPWDYQRAGPVDIEEQRRAYAAFTSAWTGSEVLGGVFFWIWDGAGGARDRGYTPRAKPAEAVLRRWFAGAAR
ncbi:glycoside hydrolase family 113 [Haliangium ochraceum]|uniref:GTA TIM-barrel-like domain-containing protein n=1 Tax=Haliangium ochraceum (strain DSM 14365 / JCM 11303 / SMP-2) TaxID=502025 RepID=D0LW32_HALO1|nr:hypothetical protein [Haliangium ochraceum]ACY15964.1 conserved hypothetical protein [Haliangium ochraceum DSM 14365]